MPESTPNQDDITTGCTREQVAEVIRKKRKKGFKLLAASWSTQEKEWKLLWDPDAIPAQPT